VLVVEAELAKRLTRLVERGLTEEDARARIASQATAEQRRAVADRGRWGDQHARDRHT
jgi:dephospho-CoA kinase